MMRRDSASHRQAALLRGGDYIERGPRGDLPEMVARAGQFHEPDVALHDDRLGGGWRGGQAQPHGELAFRDRGLRRQVRVFGVPHDQRAERIGIGERAAQHAGIGDRAVAVGEGDGAGLLQQADLGHRLASEALGECRRRCYPHLCGSGGAAQDEVDQRRLVDHRLGVRHHDDGGDAAGQRGVARRFQRLAIFAARLAGEDARVDQSRRQYQTFGIDHLGIVRLGIVEQARADIGNAAVLDQQSAFDVQTACRIDQAGVLEGDAARHGAPSSLRATRAGRPSLANPRDKASSTAMRIATPISTCSWIRLISMSSATAESISTPRFIGPGCMTRAPGLAA